MTAIPESFQPFFYTEVDTNPSFAGDKSRYAEAWEQSSGVRLRLGLGLAKPVLGVEHDVAAVDRVLREQLWSAVSLLREKGPDGVTVAELRDLRVAVIPLSRLGNKRKSIRHTRDLIASRVKAGEVVA